MTKAAKKKTSVKKTVRAKSAKPKKATATRKAPKKKTASRPATKPKKTVRSRPVASAKRAAARKPVAKKTAARKPAAKPAKPSSSAKPKAMATKAPAGKPTARSLLERFTPEHAALLRPHLRAAFVPQVKAGGATGPVTKIAGEPWLPAGAEWPVCPNCKRPMQLILQLDLETLPAGAGAHGKGLAQLFYCLSSDPLCEVDCEAFFAFSKSCVARLVDGHAPGKDAEPRETPNALRPKRIVGWKAAEDLPNTEELDELGVSAEYDGPLWKALQAAQRPLPKDKLGGWPCWSQSPEYPSCPECKAPMRLLFQIDSDDAVGCSWGDGGCGHLTQCATHPNQLAFGWACG